MTGKILSFKFFYFFSMGIAKNYTGQPTKFEPF